MDSENDFPYENSDERKPSRKEVCKRIIFQHEEVSIPVELKPTAKVEEIEAECCGEPKVETEKCNGTCRIKITQKIKITIPVQYDIATKVGRNEIDCHTAECM